MNHYKQLQEFERVLIYECLKRGKSKTMIAQEMRRDKSTISREIARNSDHIGYLSPRDAQRHTEDRKARHRSKIDRNSNLRDYVLEKVLLG